MQVDLPQGATGQKIAEAIDRAAKKLGYSCDLNTQYKFVPGSVKKIPQYYSPHLSKRTGRLWGKTELFISPWCSINESFNANSGYGYVKVKCRVPVLEPPPFSSSDKLVTATSDPLYKKVELYFEECVRALYKELGHEE